MDHNPGRHRRWSVSDRRGCGRGCSARDVYRLGPAGGYLPVLDALDGSVRTWIGPTYSSGLGKAAQYSPPVKEKCPDFFAECANSGAIRHRMFVVAAAL